jgi:Dolichyl-phosphate-mannose-protein mannosyltransferase
LANLSSASLPLTISSLDAAENQRSSSRLKRLAAGLFLFGALVRIVGFLQNASLNGDEAMLALSIGRRSFSELLQPLDYGQVAPVPFLWAERLITHVGGVSGYGLRIVPLTVGIVLLWVVYRLTAVLWGPVQAVVALALAATSYPLMRYSVEVKPYIIDGLVSALLIWMAVRLASDLENRRNWALLGLAGSAGVLLSSPALLVCAGIGAGLVVAVVRSRRLYLISSVALLGLVWGSIFAAAYVSWYAPNASAPYIQEFWAANFLLLGRPDFAVRLWSSLAELSCTLTCWRGIVDLWPILLGLTIVGLITVSRARGPEYAVLLVGPVAAAFAASMLGRYPLGTRLLLFCAPILAVATAVGAVALATRVERSWPRLRARWILLLLVYPSLILAAALAFAPPTDWGFRGTEVQPLAELYQRRGAGEPVYVFPRAVPAWVFHTTDWGAPDTARLDWVAAIAGPNGLGSVNGSSRGRRRFGEGMNLVYSSPFGMELYGTSSGVQVRRGHLSSPKPDSGWAETEAWRIRQAARPYIWMILADYAHGPLDERAILMKAVTAAGGEVVFTSVTPDAILVRLRFSPAAKDSARGDVGTAIRSAFR